jgi:trans-aconitate 2-methyltransferase
VKHHTCLFIVFFGACFSLWSEDRWLAELYALYSDPQRICSLELISQYPFQGNEHILQVGSSDGTIAQVLADRFPESSILALDSSNAMIEYSKKKTQKYKNLSFSLMENEKLPFEAEFDLVMAFFFLEWASDQAKMVKSFATALKKGGRVLLLNPSRMPVELQEAARETMHRPKWEGFFKEFLVPIFFPAKEEMLRYLAEAGLICLKFEEKNKHFVFPSQEALEKTLEPSFPYLDAIPKELKDTFLAELTSAYLRRCPSDRFRRVFLTLDLYEVWAYKP